MADITSGPPPSSAPQNSSGEKPQRRRIWLRRLLIGVGIAAFLLLFVALITPTLLSTNAGRGFLVSQINKRIPGKVSIDGLRLAWFGGQQIDHLTLQDPDGKVMVEVKSISAGGLTLWNVVRGSYDMGPIDVIEPVGNFEQYADGTSNMVRAIKGAEPRAPKAAAFTMPTVPAGLSVKLNVTGGDFTFTAPGLEPVKLNGLTVTADLLDLQNIQIATHVDVVQGGDTGKFDLKASGSVLDADGRIKSKGLTANVTGTVTDLPLAMIDRFCRLDGMLAEAIGPKLNVKFDADIKPGSDGTSTPTFALLVTAQNILIDIHRNAQTMVRTFYVPYYPEQGTITIQPALAAYFLNKTAAQSATTTAAATQPSHPQLLEPVKVALDFMPITLPIKDGKVDLGSALGSVSATIDRIVTQDVGMNGIITVTGTQFGGQPEHSTGGITIDGTIAKVVLPSMADRAGANITNIKLSASAAGLDKPITENLDADIAQGTQKGSVHLGVTTQDLTKLLTVTLQATFADSSGTAPPGKIDSKTDISNLSLTDGKLGYENATVQTNINVDDVPVPLVDQLLGRDGELVGLLGNSATLKVNGSIAPNGQSPVSIVLISDNTKANLAAIVDGGMKGTLRLQNDAAITLTVTPELDKAFLTKVTGWVNPSSGDKPITLTIQHATFAMPLGDLNLKKIVADATMDMGTLNMQANDPIVGAAFTGFNLLQTAAKGGSSSNLLSMGQSILNLGKNPKDTPPQTVVFTPMTLHLENGIATYDKLDMTLENLTFAFKGNVNLDTKANNLTMSILGQSIATAFPKWASSFGPGNDLTIQIGGTYDNPQPDMKGLATQVLKLAGNISGKSKSNPVDQILKGIGNLFGKKK